MDNNRVAAYVLIGIGALFLVNNLNLGVLWLWVGLLAAAFLAGYVRRRSYGLLVSGSSLAGVAVGLLLGSGPALLISLGVGLWAASRLEPRSHRWPQRLAAAFVGLGVLGWVLTSGLFGSLALALLLIGSGVYLLRRPARNGPQQAQPYTDVEPVAPFPVQPAPVQTAPVQTSPVQTSPDRAPYSPKPVPAAPRPPQAAPEAAAPVVSEDAPQPLREGSVPQPLLEPPVPSPDPVVSVPPASATGSSQDAAPNAIQDDEPLTQALTQALTSWRTRTAQAQEVPSYIVLTNDTLRAVARTRPQTLSDLAAVKGIGPVKLERYGEAILEIVRDISP